MFLFRTLNMAHCQERGSPSHSLDRGHLDFAYLDVFRQEPLPQEHAFWRHPKIQITPHVSAVTNVETAVNQIVENYRRVKSQRPLINTINRQLGY